MIRFFQWHRDHYKGRNLGFALPVKRSSDKLRIWCVVFSEQGALGSQRSSPFGELYDATFSKPNIVDVSNHPRLLHAIGRWGRQSIREVFERWDQMK